MTIRRDASNNTGIECIKFYEQTKRPPPNLDDGPAPRIQRSSHPDATDGGNIGESVTTIASAEEFIYVTQ